MSTVRRTRTYLLTKHDTVSTSVGLASRIPLPFASGTRQMLERGSRVLYLLPLGWAHVGLARNKSCSPLDARIRAYSQKLSKRASDGFKEQGSETYVNSGA